MWEIQKQAAWIPITTATYEDHGFLFQMLNEAMWRSSLAFRGFMGLVKCERCHRPTRCLHRVGDRLYGATCASRVSRQDRYGVGADQ